MSYFSLGHRLGTALDIILHQFTPISIIFTFAFSFCITQASHCIIQMQICREFIQRGQRALWVCTWECYMLASLTFLVCYGTYRISIPCVISCVFECVWRHVRVHASWLTSHKKQDQNQAAQGQREGGREKAAQDSAPNSPHCVLKGCVYKCVCGCVCVDAHVWSIAPLWPPLLYSQTSPHTLTRTLNWFVLNSSAAGTCTQLLPSFTSVQSDRSCCLGATYRTLHLCATWNTWKRSCFGSKITHNWIAGSVSKQNSLATTNSAITMHTEMSSGPQKVSQLTLSPCAVLERTYPICDIKSIQCRILAERQYNNLVLPKKNNNKTNTLANCFLPQCSNPPKTKAQDPQINNPEKPIPNVTKADLEYCVIYKQAYLVLAALRLTKWGIP